MRIYYDKDADLTRLDGKKFSGLAGLIELLDQKMAGEEVEVKILRGNETLTKKVVLGRRNPPRRGLPRRGPR